MNLTTRLNHPHYRWVLRGGEIAEDAILTATVIANPHAGHATLRLLVGSAMRFARVPGTQAGGVGGTSFDVEVGTLEAGESRDVVVRFTPDRIYRAGRRRVAVVQVIVEDEVVASTTVWARVERAA